MAARLSQNLKGLLMKTLLITIVLSAFAYASVGALMKTVEVEKSHNNDIKVTLAMLKR